MNTFTPGAGVAAGGQRLLNATAVLVASTPQNSPSFLYSTFRCVVADILGAFFRFVPTTLAIGAARARCVSTAWTNHEPGTVKGKAA